MFNTWNLCKPVFRSLQGAPLDHPLLDGEDSSIASSNPLSLAKTGPSAILQSQGFWQHKGLKKDNTISVASSILTSNDSATLKGSPPGCTCQSEMRQFSSSASFMMASQHTQSYKAASWTPSMDMTLLSHKELCWICCLTLAMPTNNELTAHVADKETLLINCHCAFKKGNREGSTFFKSSMSAISPQWCCRSTPICQRHPASMTPRSFGIYRGT